MKILPKLLPLILISLAAACGGDGDDSGLDPTTQVLSLNATDSQNLCEWSVDLQGGAGTTHECGDGLSIEVQTVAECTSSFTSASSCDLTVAQFEACSQALADTPCSFGGEACAPLFQCM